jgi:twinkle protein
MAIKYVRAKMLEKAIRNIYDGKRDNGRKSALGKLDSFIRFARGKITAISGIPRMGKSQLMDMIVACQCLLYGGYWIVFSPEHTCDELCEKLLEILIGGPVSKKVKGTDVDKSEPIPWDEIKRANDWIHDHIIWISSDDESLTVEGILSACKNIEEGMGSAPAGILIDPWNWLEPKLNNNSTTTEYVSRSLTTFKRYAMSHRTHVYIVVHPKKIETDREGATRCPNPYDIQDSAHWFNKCDNILIVHRADVLQTQTQAHICKVKGKHLGHCGVAILEHDLRSGRYRCCELQEDFGLPQRIKDFNSKNETCETGYLTDDIQSVAPTAAY